MREIRALPDADALERLTAHHALDEFAAWQERVALPAGLEHFTISVRQPGPPGRDVNVRLTGRDALTLKRAALDLASSLETIPGVFGVEDDMPFGREQLIYELTPAGEALGLTLIDLIPYTESPFPDDGFQPVGNRELYR